MYILGVVMGISDANTDFIIGAVPLQDGKKDFEKLIVLY